MYKMQKTTLLDLKKEIDSGLDEIQLKQLDEEIKECVNLMKNTPDDANNVYKKYRQLIEERNSILSNCTNQ